MSTTWLSSAKTTYVSASKTARVSLSKSGRLSGQTRRVFGADFGFGRPKCRSIPTGPCQGCSGAKSWATSATSLRQADSPFAVEVMIGLPLTTNARVDPCGAGRPCTRNMILPSVRTTPETAGSFRSCDPRTRVRYFDCPVAIYPTSPPLAGGVWRPADNDPCAINICPRTGLFLWTPTDIKPHGRWLKVSALFQRDLRALRVVDDERDLRPAVFRREDVDRVHIDPRAGEAPGNLRELTGAVHQLQVQDVVQLELQAREGERLLGRLHIRRHDPQERVVVFRFARNRSDVHGSARKGLRDARQLS